MHGFCSPLLLGLQICVRTSVDLNQTRVEHGYLSENGCQSDMQTIDVSDKEHMNPWLIVCINLKLEILFQLYSSVWIML